MNKRLYRFVYAFFSWFFGIFHPGRVSGLENVPAQGGFILCCNHCSNRDPFYLGTYIPTRTLYFMAKIELFRFKPFAAFFRALGSFPVDRGHSDLNALRTALKLIREGHCLAIFPQGTRIKNNARTPMLEGVSILALRSGAPVIPAYIDGPYRLFRPTRIAIGPPVNLDDFPRRMDADTLNRATRRIEDAVWALKDCC